MFHKKNLTLGLLILLAGCNLICGQIDVKINDDDLVQKKPTTTTTTTTTSTTSTTTVAPAPTEAPTTKAAPTTTTPAPTKPTTTPSSTSSTTTTTTTTAAPATTPVPPKPFPEPEVGFWNSSCILIKMAAQLNFTYETNDNKTAYALLNIPKNATVYDVECNSTTNQMMQLNWGPTDYVASMVATFQNNKTISMYMLHFNIPINTTEYPDAKENQVVQLIHRGAEFDAPTHTSYHCTRAQHFNLTETVQNATVVAGVLTVHDVQTEAFRDGAKPNDNTFSTVHDCDSSQPSDIVPIAVGVALVTLILVVLTAYLCARRRSASRGYVSF